MTNRRAATQKRLTTILDRVADLQAAVADLRGMLSADIDLQGEELLGEVEATLRADWSYCLPCADALGVGQCVECSDYRHARAEDYEAGREDAWEAVRELRREEGYP